MIQYYINKDIFSVTSIERTSPTTYLIKGTGTGILYFNRVDASGTDTKIHNFNIGDYTYTHTSGERWEVSADNINFIFDNKIRHIRSWGNRNSVNEGNHWYEIEAISGATNLALNKPTSVSANATLREGADKNSDKIVDGSILLGQYASYSNGDGIPMWVSIDLEEIKSVDEIRILKSISSSRVYFGCTLQVSKDANNWITIFDGDIITDPSIFHVTEVKI